MFALIMAGGLGTRFWPKSRMKHPKQLLKILSEYSLIQNTVRRLSPFINYKDIFIVSTESQLPAIKQQLPAIPEDNYIVEPRGKNTAPCIGLSALYMEKMDPDAVMVVLPSDHLVSDNKAFYRVIDAGVRIAQEQECLITIGIKPHYPATGYGYIQYDEVLHNVDGVDLKHVKTFAEKPNLDTARLFIESGDFLWNSGIFIWRVKTILKEIEENLPHIYDGLQEIRRVLGTDLETETIQKVYKQIKSISIDYGVMEYARDVLVLEGEFGWNDLGSWDEVYKLSHTDANKNVLVGDHHIIRDSKGCLVDSPDKSVALVGVKDLIVVETGTALLICPRERAQDVKDIVDIAKRKKLDHLL
jgi:mannose-1-phosphate guanylyltransferase